MMLACPNCEKLTMNMKNVWCPDQPDSKIKCSRCGAWGMLKEWKNKTKERWMKSVEMLMLDL